ncbi:MAG: HAD family phosphatase, partial [Ruthenibacterium sp.]
MDKQTTARTALFDIDGTLLDSSSLWADIPAEYLHARGFEVSEDVSGSFFKRGYSNTARYLAQHYLPEEDPHAIMDAFCRIAASKYTSGVSEKPFAAQYLNFLRGKGIRCMAVTSNMKEIVLPALEQLHMTDSIDDIISIYDIGMDKRSPRFYLHIADLLHTPPEQCVVFEDALFAAESAKQAGMYIIGIYDKNADADWENL